MLGATVHSDILQCQVIEVDHQKQPYSVLYSIYRRCGQFQNSLGKILALSKRVKYQEEAHPSDQVSRQIPQGIF